MDEEIKPEEMDLEKEVKIPYVIKDKILMSPGVWNNFFYSSDTIKDAFKQTNWDSKDNRSLFLDHQDRLSREWIGEISNPRLNGEDLIGDLIIVDKPTAMKLHYGAKMGISPKVTGDEEENEMKSFLFNNFSVVINPAVKTAYINHSQLKDQILNLLEQAKKDNTLKAILNEVGVNTAKPEADELSEYSDFVRDYLKKNPGSSIVDAAKAWENKRGAKMEEQIETKVALEETKPVMEEKPVQATAEQIKPAELSATEQMMALLKEILEELQKKKLPDEGMKKYPYPAPEACQAEEAKKGKYPYPPEKMEEMEKHISELSQKLTETEKKLNEPDKMTVKMEQVEEKLEQDVDQAMLDHLKGLAE